MVSISKNSLNCNMFDGDEVVWDEVLKHITFSNEAILAYDTENDVVFHSRSEILGALGRVDVDIINIFLNTYSKECDIHDCIENGVIDLIVSSIVLSLSSSAVNKKFVSFIDFIEELLVDIYNTSRVVENA